MEHRKYAVARYPQSQARPSGEPRIDIFDQTDQQVTDIWDSNDFYSKVHLNLDWLKALMAKQPNKLAPKPIEKKARPEGYTLSEDGHTLLKVWSNVTHLVIPLGVTKIAREAALNHLYLEEVVIPPTVKIIGDKALAGCYNMQRVSIQLGPGPLQTETFRADAFKNTTGVLEIRVSGTEDRPSSLDSGIFAESKFHEVRILPENNHSSYAIGDGCFKDCHDLTRLTLGYGCSEIRSEAFFRCTSLEEVWIPRTVQWIDWEAFSHCKNIRKFEFDPASELTDSAGCCFYDNQYVTELKIPDSCKYIMIQAFCELPNLKTLVLPAGLKYLGVPPVVLYNNGDRGEDDEYEPHDYLFDRDERNLWPKDLHVYFKGTREQWDKLTQYFTDDEKRLLNANLACLGR